MATADEVFKQIDLVLRPYEEYSMKVESPDEQEDEMEEDTESSKSVRDELWTNYAQKLHGNIIVIILKVDSDPKISQQLKPVGVIYIFISIWIILWSLYSQNIFICPPTGNYLIEPKICLPIADEIF